MVEGLKNLVEISRYYGNDPYYVIAGGGNTSFKNDEFLWIKASGTSLSTITEDGFAKMDRNCLSKLAAKTYSNDPLQREAEIIKAMFNCVADSSGKRPSVETSLHNLLNFSYVVHTHPTLVNGLMCAKNSRSESAAIFGDEVLVIEYTDPGYVLFKLVEKRIAEYLRVKGKEPQIIFLENHGVFVSANSIEEIREIYSLVMKRISEKVTGKIPFHEASIIEHPSLYALNTINKNLIGRFFQSPLISEFTMSNDEFSQVDTAFSPDNIVYCKAHYLFTRPDPESILTNYLNFEKKYGYFPKVIGDVSLIVNTAV